MRRLLFNVSAAVAVLARMLRQPGYALITSVLAGATFALSVWLPNLDLIWTVLTSPHFTAGETALFLWFSLGAIATNFSVLAAVMTGTISVLFGLNVALAIYYFKRRVQFQRAAGVSIAGMLLGLIGIGCASCGSIVLSLFLGIGATAMITTALPFGGQEFSMVGAAILLCTLYVTAKKTADPLVCAIDPSPKID